MDQSNLHDLFQDNGGGVVSLCLAKKYSIGYLTKKVNVIDYSDTKENIRRNEINLIENVTGCKKENIFFIEQEHSDSILDIDNNIQSGAYVAGSADALITASKMKCLVIRTADCVPVIIVDYSTGTVANIHSGWRSTEKNIVGKVINKMITVYNCDPSFIKVFILPSIGPQSYVVNKDVGDKFQSFVRMENDSYYLDLWSCIENSIVREGIKEESIYNMRKCSQKNNDFLFSHRAGDIGRQLNFVFIKE